MGLRLTILAMTLAISLVASWTHVDTVADGAVEAEVAPPDESEVAEGPTRPPDALESAETHESEEIINDGDETRQRAAESDRDADREPDVVPAEIAPQEVEPESAGDGEQPEAGDSTDGEVEAVSGESDAPDGGSTETDSTDGGDGEPDEADATTDDTTENGLRLWGVCRITHYCNCAECCGQWSGGPTASGVMPTAGRTVAAELPFGTRLLIGGVEYVVEDRGVSGMCVDVYVTSHDEAMARGMYETEVYIIE